MPTYATRAYVDLVNINIMKKFILNDIGTTRDPHRERFTISRLEEYNPSQGELIGMTLLVSDHEDVPGQISIRTNFRRRPDGVYGANHLVLARIVDTRGQVQLTPNSMVVVMLEGQMELGLPPGTMMDIPFKYLSVFESISETVVLTIGDMVRIRPNTRVSDSFSGQAEFVGPHLEDRNLIRLILADGNEWNFRKDYINCLEVTTKAGAKNKILEKLTIGSDIEFSFIKDGKQVNVREVMVESFRETGEVGTDHSGGVGEFRPIFGNNPLEHVANLKKAIKHIIEGGYMKEDTFLDASHIPGQYVLGGHIHFGVTDPVMIKKCQKNLDYWLLPTIQPLFPKDIFKKRAEGYGRLGSGNDAIRAQSHGFEYRLVPSFIFNEGITKGIFCLAYMIVKLTIEGKLKVRMDETDQRWKDNFMKHYNDYGLTELNDVREEAIKKLLNKNLVGDYIKYINPLFDAIKYGTEFSGDIAEGWGLEYEYVLNRRRETTTETIIRFASRRQGQWLIQGDSPI